MSRSTARSIEAKHGWKVRVVDLRWLVPLNEDFIRAQAASAKRILVVDDGEIAVAGGVSRAADLIETRLVRRAAA